MARYRIENVIVDTDKARCRWEQNTRWYGKNYAGVSTGNSWMHETLYLSSKGRYYVVNISQYQGSKPLARFMTEAEAAAWLLENSYELPDGLEKYRAEVSE